MVSADVLSDLLRNVRLRGALFFHVDGQAPWVAEAPAACDILQAVMPAAEHMIEFHGIIEGSCWAALVGEPPVRLHAGDIVLFPQGDPHVMSSAPGMRAEQVDLSLYFAARPSQLPFRLRVGDPAPPGGRPGAAGHDSATLVCGFLGCDARPYNPLLSALPRVLHMPGAAAGDRSWMGQFMRTAVEESGGRRPGGEAVLERMSELMFVDVLRRHADTLSGEQTGWLAGMRDPGVGRVLALLHARPSEPWTIEGLGEEAGLSRSVLHERFMHFIGTPPMQYLTQWRMQLAAARLRESDDKVLEIALDVGYESEAAFARAFRRLVGDSPGAWRRARRQTAKAKRATAAPLEASESGR
ncbi:MAG: AraC family transcriptional regulator [Candidatus Eisenbacteria bacterium]